MMLRIVGLGMVAVMTLMLSTCKLGSIDEPIIVPFVDQEFVFDLWENLANPYTSRLEVSMQTIETVECLNTTILSNYALSGQDLKLTLFEILDPENCDPGTAPAQGIEQINSLETGLYSFEIELQGIVTNSGTLSVTSLSYEVEMDEQNGIQWLHKELFRVPNNAIWGYLTYTDAAELAEAQTFISELAAISTELSPNDGYYGYFDISGNGNQLAVLGMPEPSEAEAFLLRFGGTNSMLGELVTDFRANATAGVSLVLRDDKGNNW